jgi:SAM-dependent methyltransferase
LNTPLTPQRLLVEATEANFEEGAYLRANPDVARAVAAGECPSARAHFDAFGRHERRNVRLPVDPSLKATKLARVRPLLQEGVVQGETSTLIDCLPHATRIELHLDPTDNISSHEYDEHALAIIGRHRDGLVLDCGAGQRHSYYPNVVNYEIVDYDSTDVLGAAERLPFQGDSFDAVLSLNVLEHVKDPFQAAREIMRVMKPGAELMCVAPFLQPLHGYPHHYYNMTAQGLKNLFEPLRDKQIDIYGAMHPIWALTWFLDAYHSGLPQEQQSSFEKMTIGSLLQSPAELEKLPFATSLSHSAKEELAAAHALFGKKPSNAS